MWPVNLGIRINPTPLLSQRMENMTTERTHNDLWQIFTNPLDWKMNYIHPSYDEYLTKKRPQFPQPCPDVYHFPLLSSESGTLISQYQPINFQIQSW